jgi:hypothetical protein
VIGCLSLQGRPALFDSVKVRGIRRPVNFLNISVGIGVINEPVSVRGSSVFLNLS